MTKGCILPTVAEPRPSPPRPLDALRRATFAHAAHIDLVRAFDATAGESPDGGVGVTAPSPSAALKPKRKGGKR